MAKILFQGRLIEDAKKLNDKGFAVLTVAENIGFGEEQKTNYFECRGSFSDKQIDYLKKGTLVDIVGEYQTEKNVKDEKTYYNSHVKIYHFSFVSQPKKKEDEEK